MTFLEELRVQRYDDHRYYHHSRINQSLHLLSATSFLAAYALIVVEPVAAVLLGWFVAMWTRQVGHFLFEPKGYDEINDVTHEYKEAIKVGYNLQRKIVLLGLWAAIPVVLYENPAMFGLVEAHTNLDGYLHNLAVLWLWLGVGALALRTVQLFFISGVQSGLVWCTKILTDPFHDIKLYRKAPAQVLKGELYAP